MSYQRLDQLTRRWWFFVLLFVLLFVPSYTARPYDPRATSDLITAVLSHPLIYSWPAIMPLFKILPVLLILLIVWRGGQAAVPLSLYAGLTLLLMAVFQNSAVTEKFGLGVLLGNVITYALVAAAWLWEAVVRRNDLTPRRRAAWAFWPVPLALLAFWFPTNPATLQPDWRLPLLFTNEAGLTLCMMLPLYLTILVVYYPTVNLVTLRVTAFAGLLTGVMNVIQWFVLASQPWLGLMHVPLLTLGAYALVLSLRHLETDEAPATGYRSQGKSGSRPARGPTWPA